jgi:hypothetical protein
MFRHHCTACERDQLIFSSQFTGVASTDRGAVGTFTCWCGADQQVLISATSVDPVAA